MSGANGRSARLVYIIYAGLALWAPGAHATTSSPSTDNAALLYYQAFLLRPDPDMDTYEKINEVLRGAQPDETVREYVERCREAIKVAEAAGRTPQCNWGIGLWSLSQLVPSSKLSQLLAVDARILAADSPIHFPITQQWTLIVAGISGT